MDNDWTKYVKGNIGEWSQLDQYSAKLLKDEVCKSRINNYTTIKPNEESNKIINRAAIKNKEKEEREEESLRIQKETLETQKLMLFLIQCINKDNKEIVENLQSLINTIQFQGKVEEANLLIIEKELESIKKNTSNIQQKFVEMAKEKLTEKGVEYTIMFILQGLKMIFLNVQGS
ncbi:hypothetical protein FDB72_17480 [Clostridium botulinum]|uniref:Uncharacterized protein n=1 Tax=Clostridium botulinum TaxID=1491 RepID=A0A6G4CKW9_CLOBO|nr:hypothetical protein [Clostridium botulinum]NEZ99779.1 hypothetical protein [Clostridium botulinum]NFA31225.1 hypothetical protein [Clostridium botulinum]NFA85456.1 hypothetical protein [Clostridium botulinum]NFB06718.1 hypothetical protein [Clostridium botulinum]